MKRPDIYIDLKGQSHSLDKLDPDECQLVDRLDCLARQTPSWMHFRNSWMAEVHRFYTARGLTRAQSQQTVVYRIAQDIGSRLMIAAGMARAPDARDDLQVAN